MNNLISSLELTHFPVMLSEVIKISSPTKGGIYFDCTFGGGGYSRQLLKYSNTTVKGIDRDDKVKEIGAWLETQDFGSDITTQFRGQQEETEEVTAFLSGAAVTALALMLILLVTQFNSFYQSFLVLSAVFMSIVGV